MLNRVESQISNSSSYNITITPPNNATGDVTDEDSGDEDGGGLVNNFPGSMLIAPATLEDEVSQDEEEVELVEPKRKNRKLVQDKKYEKRDISSEIPEFSSASHCVTQTLKEENLTPSKYFKLF